VPDLFCYVKCWRVEKVWDARFAAKSDDLCFTTLLPNVFGNYVSKAVESFIVSRSVHLPLLQETFSIRLLFKEMIVNDLSYHSGISQHEENTN
jgi:hypothetical protein